MNSGDGPSLFRVSSFVTQTSFVPVPLRGRNLMLNFTPAAERVLRQAAAWKVAAVDEGLGLHPIQVLFGLLEESESLGASILLDSGITQQVLIGEFPAQKSNGISLADQPFDFSLEMRDSLCAAEEKLWAYPRPLFLATEHLLLGIACGNSQATFILREHGVHPDRLENLIHERSGHNPGPLPMPVESAPPDENPHKARCRMEAAEGADGAENVPGTVVNVSGETPSNSSVGREVDGRIWRILDAAENRAREGLRTIEDYVRFTLDDGHLTNCLKEARHGLRVIFNELQVESRLAFRETLQDVGTALEAETELSRANLASICQANFKRVQEALRSLEEFVKLVSPDAARSLKQLRYRCYTLEKSISATEVGRAHLASAPLCVLVDGRASREEFCDLCRRLVRSGVPVIQLREKKLCDRELLDRALALKEIVEGTPTLAIMNDRPDLAQIAKLAGVHLGQDDLSVHSARQIVGSNTLIGVSTHSLAQAHAAVMQGANYIGMGPMFSSRTKNFPAHEIQGPELARQIRGEISLPAFAIGGITTENLPQLMDAGVLQIAVSSSIVDDPRPEQAAGRFLAILAKAAR